MVLMQNSILPREGYEDQGLSSALKVGSIAAINSMNSITKAKEEGAILETIAQTRVSLWEEWKMQYSRDTNAHLIDRIVNQENM